jgi:hypothetical protein
MQRDLVSHHSGITRIEVLVLITVFVALSGLLITAFPKVRERPYHTQNMNNLKQMSLAMANLSGNFFGKVPAGYGPFPGAVGPYYGYFFMLLPFIEQDEVYKKWAIGTPIKTYIAPNDPTNPGNTAASSYSLNARALGGYCPKGPVVTYPGTFNHKGTSNTITIVERYASLNGPWRGAPADNADGSCILYGPHTDIAGAIKDPSFCLPDTDPRCSVTANGYSIGSVQVALADGSSRNVSRGSTRWPEPSIGTSVWGWAISATGPDEGKFGKAPPPADW